LIASTWSRSKTLKLIEIWGRIRFKSSQRDAIVTEMIFYKIPVYFGRLQLA